DFSQINPAAGQYQAPVAKEGLALMRTRDFTNPNSWEAWSGGSIWEPVSNYNCKTFLPKREGVTLPMTLAPTFIYDTNAQVTICVWRDTSRGIDEVGYITTRSLASPSWSDWSPVLGMGTLGAAGTDFL